VTSGPVPEDRRELAAAHGVATSYRNERRDRVEVDADVVVKVLGLLEVDARNQTDRRRDLARLTERGQADRLAPTIAVRVGGHPQALPGAALLVAEDGAELHWAMNCPVTCRPVGSGFTPATANKPPFLTTYRPSWPPPNGNEPS
jgi:4-alpha-glucanotransferase